MYTRRYLNEGYPDFAYSEMKDGHSIQKSLSPLFYSSGGWSYDPRPGTHPPPIPRNWWLQDVGSKYASLTNQSDERHRVGGYSRFLELMREKGLNWW